MEQTNDEQAIPHSVFFDQSQFNYISIFSFFPLHLSRTIAHQSIIDIFSSYKLFFFFLPFLLPSSPIDRRD